MNNEQTSFEVLSPRPSSNRARIIQQVRAWFPSRGNVLFTVLLVTGLLWAQNAGALSPRQTVASTSVGTIAYQGRLADAAGQPIEAETYNMVFRLYPSNASDAIPLWEENWTGSNSVEVSDGLFNVMLGSLNPIPQTVLTTNTSLFLGITVDSDNEMTPRIQLGTVPYAAQALTVPDGSITTVKLAGGAVTQDKLDPALEFIPTGAIVLWGGALNAVPSGWQVCDGSNGTPDLRDRFVVGAGSSYAVGDTGGAAQVSLTTDQIPAHTHSVSDKFTDGGRVDNGSAAWDATNDKNPRYVTENKNTGSTGGGQAHENRPPYYALAFICKQ